MDIVSLAHPTLFMVLSAQRTLVTHRFSWVNSCVAYHYVHHCIWVVALLHHGCLGCVHHARPPIPTRNRLLPPCSFPLHLPLCTPSWCDCHALFLFCRPLWLWPHDWSSARSDKIIFLCCAIVHWLLRASVVMHHSDLIIMLQMSVMTTCNQFCHRLLSSFESKVQEVSRSHEIRPSAVGFARSWSFAIIW